MKWPQKWAKDAPESMLVLAAKGRDQRAFGILVQRRQQWLRALLYRMSGNAAQADDLAQDAFLQAWQYLPRLQNPSAFGAWLRRIAVTCFLQAMRKKGDKMDPIVESDQFADDAPSTQDAVAARLDLERALGGLSPAERLCVTLSYGEGLSHGEIMEATGLPLGTIKSHIARGAEKMRRILNENPGTAGLPSASLGSQPHHALH